MVVAESRPLTVEGVRVIQNNTPEPQTIPRTQSKVIQKPVTGVSTSEGDGTTISLSLANGATIINKTPSKTNSNTKFHISSMKMLESSPLASSIVKESGSSKSINLAKETPAVEPVYSDPKESPTEISKDSQIQQSKPAILKVNNIHFIITS